MRERQELRITVRLLAWAADKRQRREGLWEEVWQRPEERVRCGCPRGYVKWKLHIKAWASGGPSWRLTCSDHEQREVSKARDWVQLTSRARAVLESWQVFVCHLRSSSRWLDPWVCNSGEKFWMQPQISIIRLQWGPETTAQEKHTDEKRKKAGKPGCPHLKGEGAVSSIWPTTNEEGAEWCSPKSCPPCLKVKAHTNPTSFEAT